MRGKNILWISFIAMFLGTLAIVPAGKSQAYPTLYIDPVRIPSEGVGHIGDVYDLSVKVENVTNLWAVGFKIQFAPLTSVLTISQIMEASFMSEEGWYPTWFTYSIDLISGTAYVGITRVRPSPEEDPYGVSGSGTLVTFKLTVIEAGVSPIELVDSKLLECAPDLPLMPHTAIGSAYYGSYAYLIRAIPIGLGRKIHVGETLTFPAKVKNEGVDPLYVKVRYDIVRAEDGRRIVVRSGQEYFGWGIGETPPQVINYLYANYFTGHYAAGWGWNYVGTTPYLNAVGDGSYVWTDAALMEEGEYPGYYPYTGRYDFEDMGALLPEDSIYRVQIEAYTLYGWGLDEGNDLDTYMRAPITEAAPSTWVGSLWGDGTWGWHTVRWTTDTIDTLYPITKTPAGVNGVRVRFIMYWTADDLEHGRVDIDALRLKVTIQKKSLNPEVAPEYLVNPGEVLTLDDVTWVAKTDHIGSYTATATIEYTYQHLKWNSWGSEQKVFYFKIVP